MRFVLPGLPRASLAALVRRTDAQLGRALARHALALRPLALAHGEALASFLNLPLPEVIASPFGFRMCAMGAAVGVSSVAHETRRVLGWHPSFRPLGDEVEEGRWRDGVLHVGKYQQFCADEPRSIYHPEQHAKWAPHELLHRACGSFFRPDASRFELYLGARLNELLPVATWYGIEHTLRLDEIEGFDRKAALARHEATSGALFWLHAPREALEARAIAMAPLFREGIVHAERELAACAKDLASGEVSTVAHAHAFLDASSDAIGYVATHTERLRSPGVAKVHALLDEHTAEVAAYQRRIEQVFDALLFAPLTFDLRRATSKRAHRRGWDRALRLAHAKRDATSADLEALLRGQVEGPPSVRLDGETPDLKQLAAGLEATLPQTFARVPRLAARLAAHPAFMARAPLGERVARMLDTPALSELARLESALSVSRPSDDRVEVLEDLRGPSQRPATALLSRAFFVMRFDTDPLALLRDEAPRPGPTAALVGRFRGEGVLIELDLRYAEAFERGTPQHLPREVQRSLAEAGALLLLSR